MDKLTSELTFRVIYAVVYLSVVFIRVYYGRKAQTPACLVGWLAGIIGKKITWKSLKEVAKREGKLSLALWLILSLFWISFTFLYVIFPESISWSALPFPTWLRWIGVALGIVSLPLLLWIHQTLGKYWRTTLELREQHRMVTDGPYRWVRHPMYTQSITFFTALSLVSANPLMVLSTIIEITLILTRIRKEERMMIERFGDQYHNYVKRTGRLLPRIGGDKYDKNDQKNKKFH